MSETNSMSCTAMVYVADSDDSDNEGGLGNVEKVVMRPPGHSGKAKKGHLCFDAIFESGNLGRVDFINEFEYDLYVRPDTCNPRYRFWFNFSVENVHENQRIIFNIVNLSKSKNLFRVGLTPIVRSSSRACWQRIPQTNVYYYKSPEHNDNYVLSFAFAFDRDGEKYQFALSYPYTYSRCQEFLDQLSKKDVDFLWRETLLKTIQGRNLDLLTITEPLKPDYDEELFKDKKSVRKRVVVVMARQQPGESPSSLMVQGLIDFLVSKHRIALQLREKLIFKIFPMMNPDGVFLGNYKGSLFGTDLNRVWDQSSSYLHPTVQSADQIIASLAASTEQPLDFVLDLHVSNALLGFYIIGNAYDSVFRNERHIVFPKMLAQNCRDFSSQNTMYNKDPDKAGTARRHLSAVIESESTNVYSLEMSMYGYKPDKKSNKIIAYTEEHYLEQGRNICKALWDFYKISGHIEGSKVDIEDFETEREEPVVQATSEVTEVESSFKFPANMFPVNPNYETHREIDDQEIESIMSSNVQSRKSSLQETKSLSKGDGAPYEDILSHSTIKSSSLVVGVVGRALSVDKGRRTEKRTRRKGKVDSARVHNRKLTEKFSPAYDASISPLELRNHNLYVQSIQQRQHLHLMDPPLPSLHPNFHLSKQKAVGGGGCVLQTRLLPASSQPSFIPQPSRDDWNPNCDLERKTDDTKCNLVYLKLNANFEDDNFEKGQKYRSRKYKTKKSLL